MVITKEESRILCNSVNPNKLIMEENKAVVKFLKSKGVETYRNSDGSEFPIDLYVRWEYLQEYANANLNHPTSISRENKRLSKLEVQIKNTLESVINRVHAGKIKPINASVGAFHAIMQLIESYSPPQLSKEEIERIVIKNTLVYVPGELQGTKRTKLSQSQIDGISNEISSKLSTKTEDELNIRQIKNYVQNQIAHCNNQIESNENYNMEIYIHGTQATDEQMSGYYQGRLEANHAMINLLNEMEKTDPHQVKHDNENIEE